MDNQHSHGYHETHRIWAGHGHGNLCQQCAAPIRAHEVEYEVEWERSLAVAPLHFHLACYHKWTHETQPNGPLELPLSDRAGYR